MNDHRNEFLGTRPEQTITDPKDHAIKGRRTGQKNAMTETCGIETDQEGEESLLRLELPIVVSAWVIILITFGYLIYVGV